MSEINTVNLENYKIEALKSAYYPNIGSNREYPMIAIFEECVEIFEKIENSAPKEDLIKEIGDLMWYMAMLFTEFKKPFIFKRFDVCEDHSSFIIKTGDLSSIFKKTLRDDNGIFKIENLIEFFKIVDDLMSYVCSKAEENGYSIFEVGKINIEKINDRIARGVLSGKGDNR